MFRYKNIEVLIFTIEWIWKTLKLDTRKHKYLTCHLKERASIKYQEEKAIVWEPETGDRYNNTGAMVEGSGEDCFILE